MRKFMINVNGKSYEVDVEEINGAAPIAKPVSAPAPVSAPVAAPTPVAAAPVAKEQPKEAPKPAPVAVPSDATNISSPMPGTILAVKVGLGDTVEKGQVLVIIEAMKMENEIMAPKAGKIVSLSAVNGATINTGDALVSIA